MLAHNLEALLGFVPDRLMVIDPRVGKPTGHEERAQLRALPMFADLGLSRFTYSAVWHPDIQLTEYTYRPLSEDTVDQVDPPFCQIVSQSVENHSSSNLTRRILQRDMDEPFVLITDQDTFSLKHAHGGRTVKEDYNFHTVSYENIFQLYLRDFLEIDPPAIGLSKTKNAVYHKIAETHRQNGLTVTDLGDLFDFSEAPAESAAWDILLEFCQEREHVLEEFDKYVRQNLRPWTERGEVGTITTAILDVLQERDFSRDKIKHYRDTREGKG